MNSSRSRWTLSILGLALVFMTGPRSVEARLFVPMDLKQTDHLKAYGLAYWTLARGQTMEWLLNYRGGSFMLDDNPDVVREAQIRGVLIQQISESDAEAIYQQIGMNPEGEPYHLFAVDIQTASSAIIRNEEWVRQFWRSG